MYVRLSSLTLVRALKGRTYIKSQARKPDVRGKADVRVTRLMRSLPCGSCFGQANHFDFAILPFKVNASTHSAFLSAQQVHPALSIVPGSSKGGREFYFDSTQSSDCSHGKTLSHDLFFSVRFQRDRFRRLQTNACGYRESTGGACSFKSTSDSAS
jgi:hypothetical protein